MAHENGLCLHTRHETLWADKCLDLHAGLLACNYIQEADADIPNDVIMFYGGFSVTRFFTVPWLDDLKSRSSIIPILFVSGI